MILDPTFQLLRSWRLSMQPMLLESDMTIRNQVRCLTNRMRITLSRHTWSPHLVGYTSSPLLVGK